MLSQKRKVKDDTAESGMIEPMQRSMLAPLTSNVNSSTHSTVQPQQDRLSCNAQTEGRWHFNEQLATTRATMISQQNYILVHSQ
jgi:hypothetical protein